MNDYESYPRKKNGRFVLPAIGESVYVPTETIPEHFIGGRATVTGIRRGASQKFTQLEIAERPGVNYMWYNIQREQDQLWRHFKMLPPRSPTDEEVAALAKEKAFKEERTRQYVEAQAKKRSARPVERTFSENGRMRPTHLLKVKEKDGPGHTTVGAGWLCDDGSFSIKLGPCVALSWTDDVTIKLFPVEEG